MIKKGITYIKNNKSVLLYTGIGLGAVVASVALYKIVKSVKGFFEAPKIDRKITDNLAVTVNTARATINEATAREYAQRLLDAMDDKDFLGFGTDEATILHIFKKLRNPEDFKMVYNAFGKKDYDGQGLPPDNFTAKFISRKPLDLIGWLRSELSVWDREVYSLVKRVVESAGFAFN